MDLFDIAVAKKLAGGGGGSAVIESLSVTENGTYTAPSGVDGYSPVTVNVSGGGGSSNVVTGSFTVPEITTAEGTAYSINTGYSGNGYITAFVIVCSSSSHLDVVGAYTYSSILCLKTYNKMSPTYTGVGNGNKTTSALARLSSSNLSFTTDNGERYSADTPTGNSGSVLSINNKNTIQVYVAGTSTNYRGLKSGETYQYWVLYSE